MFIPQKLLSTLITYPLIPYLIYQGKKVRQTVPELPSALEPEGIVTTKSDKQLEVLFIGESTIAGLGVQYHRDGFAGVLARLISQQYQCNVNWYVYAKSGYTASMVAKKLIPKTKHHHPQLIVIGLGGNDAFRLHTTQRWTTDIEKIITGFQDLFSNCPIVFINMPPIKQFPAFPKLVQYTVGNWVEKLGIALKRFTQDMNQVYFYDDILTTAIGQQNDLSIDDLFSDGVHPSELTYKLWAQKVNQFIVLNSILI